MTNSLSIVLGLLLIAGIALDLFLTDGDSLLFLARKFADLIDWVAFWR
ncbi:glyceraldehyde-3-phosphate dehydrogenase [Primorskyibacter sedentarius]